MRVTFLDNTVADGADYSAGQTADISDQAAALLIAMRRATKASLPSVAPAAVVPVTPVVETAVANPPTETAVAPVVRRRASRPVIPQAAV